MTARERHFLKEAVAAGHRQTDGLTDGLTDPQSGAAAAEPAGGDHPAAATGADRSGPDPTPPTRAVAPHQVLPRLAPAGARSLSVPVASRETPVSGGDAGLPQPLSPPPPPARAVGAPRSAGSRGEDGGAGAMELKRSMAIPRLLVLGLWAAVLQDVAAVAGERG